MLQIRAMAMIVLAWSWIAPGSAAAKLKIDAIYPYIRDIQQATAPGDASVAYQVGLNQDPNHVPLRRAYLRRMVEFGLAGSLTDPAKALLELDPNNALAWAVVAFNQAERGAMEDAFASLVRAARDRPADPFVANLAGQLVAWVDVQPDESALPKPLREAADVLRRRTGGKHAFAVGYKTAHALLTQPRPRTPKAPPRAPPKRAPARRAAPQPLPAPARAGTGSAAYVQWDPTFPDTYLPGYILVYPQPYRRRPLLGRRVGVILKPDGSKVILTRQHPIGGVDVPPGAPLPVPSGGRPPRQTGPPAPPSRPAVPGVPPPKVPPRSRVRPRGRAPVRRSSLLAAPGRLLPSVPRPGVVVRR